MGLGPGLELRSRVGTGVIMITVRVTATGYVLVAACVELVADEVGELSGVSREPLLKLAQGIPQGYGSGEVQVRFR